MQRHKGTTRISQHSLHNNGIQHRHTPHNNVISTPSRRMAGPPQSKQPLRKNAQKPVAVPLVKTKKTIKEQQSILSSSSSTSPPPSSTTKSTSSSSDINALAQELDEITKLDKTLKTNIESVANINDNDIDNIFTTDVRLDLPKIPLRGNTHVYWGLKDDPNNPFTFPILNLTNLLDNNDITSSIKTQDSDISADKVTEQYRMLMSAAASKEGSAQSAAMADLDNMADASLNTATSQDNNTSINDNTHMYLNLPADVKAKGLSMSTSRVEFKEPFLIISPVRQSHLNNVKKVFNIKDKDDLIAEYKQRQIEQQNRQQQQQNDTNTHKQQSGQYRKATLSDFIKPGDGSDDGSGYSEHSQPNPEIDPTQTVLLQKANNGNKRFDIYLVKHNDDDAKPSLIFSSNITQLSLENTLKRRTDEYNKLSEIAQQNKRTIQPLYNEHVCIERNIILELENEPQLIDFTTTHTDDPDPIVKFLSFPVVSSITTYVTNDIIGTPSMSHDFRRCEAQFLIQSCLMGVNFPAPIDPSLSSMIRMDFQHSLDNTMSDICRETIGRCIVASYGHSAMFAALPWDTHGCVVKPDHLQYNDELSMIYAYSPVFYANYALYNMPTEELITMKLQEELGQLKDAGVAQDIIDRLSELMDEYNLNNKNMLLYNQNNQNSSSSSSSTSTANKAHDSDGGEEAPDFSTFLQKENKNKITTPNNNDSNDNNNDDDDDDNNNDDYNNNHHLNYLMETLQQRQNELQLEIDRIISENDIRQTVQEKRIKETK